MSKVNDILKEIGQALVSKKFWIELIIMTLGMVMTAICVYYFLVPSKLIVGSISGLSIVLTNIFQSMGINISLSMMITVINAILLILAYLLIGKEFGLKTLGLFGNGQPLVRPALLRCHPQCSPNADVLYQRFHRRP